MNKKSAKDEMIDAIWQYESKTNEHLFPIGNDYIFRLNREQTDVLLQDLFFESSNLPSGFIEVRTPLEREQNKAGYVFMITDVKARRRGIGNILMMKAVTRIKKAYPSMKELLFVVWDKNQAGKSLAAVNGFRLRKRQGEWETYVKKL